MEYKSLNIDCKLSLVDYCEVVENIAREYFNDELEYKPYLGELNAMAVFYNKCVKGTIKEDIPEIKDALEMEPLINDMRFMVAYNNAIKTDENVFAFDFANAYKNALKMVEVKKTSLSTIFGKAEKKVEEILNKISPLLSKENLDNVSKIASDIGKGNIGAEAIVQAYKKYNFDK